MVGGRRHVSGFKEAAMLLTELPRAMEDRVLQAAAMRGIRVMAKLLRAAAPREKGKRSKASLKYGQLHKNIKVAPFRRTREENRGARAATVSTGDSFWGRFAEFGTSKQAAKPWFRPAWASGVKPALEAVGEGLSVGIHRESEKLARKYGVKK